MKKREPTKHPTSGSPPPPLSDFGPMGVNFMHEIASPLTSAILALEQFRSHPNSELLDQLQSSIGSIEHSLLSARSHIVAEKPRLFRIVKEIQIVEHELVNRPALNHFQLSLHADPQAILFGDVEKFHFVISNLLVNALQAYEGRGGLDKRIVIMVRAQNDKTIIDIQDWAGGMTIQQTAQIFKPFYSTKPDTQNNLGLGLYIVKQFIETDFGGTITVHSVLDEGTIFSLTFPRQ